MHDIFATFFKSMSPEFISKTELLERPFTNSMDVPNYLVSTNVEASKFSASIPDDPGMQCGRASDNAIGKSGGVFALSGGRSMDMVGEHPSWHFAAPLQKVHTRIVQDFEGQEGEVLLDAVYDLSGGSDPSSGQAGSKDILSNMLPMKDVSSHPNFTKFHGPANMTKKYKITITDASGGSPPQINETLYVESGVYKVVKMANRKGAGQHRQMTRIGGDSPDAAPPVAAGGLPSQTTPGLVVSSYSCGESFLRCARLAAVGQFL